MSESNKNDELLDKLMINELLETWEKNDKERKVNEYKLINDAVNAMMLPQLQEIIDRQEEAQERYEKRIIKIRKRHQNVMKKLGKRGK